MPHVTNLDVQRISLCKLRGVNAHAHIRTTPFGPGPSTDYMVLTKVELVHHIFQTVVLFFSGEQSQRTTVLKVLYSVALRER